MDCPKKWPTYIPLQEGVLYNLGESQNVNEYGHDKGDQDESIALNEQV